MPLCIRIVLFLQVELVGNFLGRVDGGILQRFFQRQTSEDAIKSLDEKGCVLGFGLPRMAAQILHFGNPKPTRKVHF
jgi:hypothetical protein